MSRLIIRKLPQTKLDTTYKRIRYSINYYGLKYYAFSYGNVIGFSEDFPVSLETEAIDIIKRKERKK